MDCSIGLVASVVSWHNQSVYHECGLDRVGRTHTSIPFVARGGAWKMYATPPIMRNSTPCRFNNSKNSAKSVFMIRPRFPPHSLANLHALAATEREPVVEIELFGNRVGLGDPQDAFHGRYYGLQSAMLESNESRTMLSRSFASCIASSASRGNSRR